MNQSLNKPFKAITKDKKNYITYQGNQQTDPIKEIDKEKYTKEIQNKRIEKLFNDKAFYHLHKIDNTIFNATVDFFRNMKAEWVNLPITTMMISSPGEVYAGETLDYTVDSPPIKVDWFKSKRQAFLSESSQFYLELRLLLENVNKVFSIYNSFRKEKADFSHLSEFHHIEFEGNVSYEKNLKVFINLLDFITKKLVDKNKKDLKHFLSLDEIKNLKQAFSEKNIKRISFNDAMDLLYKETKNKKYKEKSLKNFGAWEEIKLTEILKKHVLVENFPLKQIAFYHDKFDSNHAKNADFILYGYRETVGSGQRIKDPKILEKKAEIFNLPKKDYKAYLQMRDQENYKQSCGFGVGWERYVQWLLKLPYIWDGTHIPRGEFLPHP